MLRYDVLSMCVSVCFAGECCVYVFQQWYTATMNLLGTWLTERMEQQLHVYQLKILIRITKVRRENTRQVDENTQDFCWRPHYADDRITYASS